MEFFGLSDKCSKYSYICALNAEWSCGRAARQSSAKACTAVRIRSGPLQKKTITDRLFCFYPFEHPQLIFGLQQTSSYNNQSHYRFQ